MADPVASAVVCGGRGAPAVAWVPAGVGGGPTGRLRTMADVAADCLLVDGGGGTDARLLGATGTGGLASFGPLLKWLAFGAVAKGLLDGGGPGGCEAQLPVALADDCDAGEVGVFATPEMVASAGGPTGGGCCAPSDCQSWPM